MADFEMYRELMASYYDQVSQLAYLFDPFQLAREYDSVYATAGSWLRDLALAVQEMTRGKRVLEIAAGHGRWTRYIVDVARHVLATDASERMLAQAKQLVAAGRPLPPPNCAFQRVDAFSLGSISLEFDCAVAVNFFQHVPRARLGVFMDSVNRKLGPGREVLIAVNRLKYSTRARFYKKPGEPDWFDLRQLSDGSVYEIIDNPFDDARIHALLYGRAAEVRIYNGAKFDWVTYRVA